MNKKEKQFKEASEMLDKACDLYNAKKAVGEDIKKAETMVILAVLAVKTAGFTVEINSDKQGFIKRLVVGY